MTESVAPEQPLHVQPATRKEKGKIRRCGDPKLKTRMVSLTGKRGICLRCIKCKGHFSIRGESTWGRELRQTVVIHDLKRV